MSGQRFFMRKRKIITGALIALCLLGIIAASLMNPQETLKRDIKDETKSSIDISAAENDRTPDEANQQEESSHSDTAASEETKDAAGETTLKGEDAASGKTEHEKGGSGKKGPDAKENASDTQQIQNAAQSPVNPGQEQNETMEKPAEDSGGSTVEKQEITCSIEIRCDAISGNGILTANGYPHAEVYAKEKQIVARTVVRVKKGATVYDVLSRVCKDNGIALDAKMSAYGTYYVKGINNLYEFMAGGNSGWVYLVNNKSPNVGCSGYQLSDGEEIVWKYVVR